MLVDGRCGAVDGDAVAGPEPPREPVSTDPVEGADEGRRLGWRAAEHGAQPATRDVLHHDAVVHDAAAVQQRVGEQPQAFPAACEIDRIGGVAAAPAGARGREPGEPVPETIVSRLATAKRLLTAGTTDDLKASVAASREACELLRKMRPATVNSAAAQRDLAEREAVILDTMTDLAQALFNYDSAASHPDPHLRDIAWRRENAVLALGTATSLAQLIFART
jgi:hypothetical protein